jgi:4-alpha-glucanotransferase
MKIHFHLHYKTIYGEEIGIKYSTEEGGENKTLILHTHNGEDWEGLVDAPEKGCLLYKYILFNNRIPSVEEWGKYRQVNIVSKSSCFLYDAWRPRADQNNALLSAAFTQAIFRRDKSPVQKTKSENASVQLMFKLTSAHIQPGLVFGVTGNTDVLGNWTTPLFMKDGNFPDWITTVPLKNSIEQIEYKYVLCNPQNSSIILWESGDNRRVNMKKGMTTPDQVVISDNFFRHADVWKGAGVAVPVFSLRSEQSMGIGEFTDLNLMVEWVSETGMNVIQLLPVNDTIAKKTWEDSYPYAAISIYALHPLYVNIDAIASFKSKAHQKAYETSRLTLNFNESVDFEKVLEQKFHFLKLLFEQEYATFKNDKSVIAFVEKHAHWIKPYAVFCHLRDLNHTANFKSWPGYSEYSDSITKALYSDSYAQFREVVFYVFIQYHAHLQLHNAREYARSKRIALKGDLPIGIYRHSCDAWVNTSLYNMEEQAGAPPDDYSELGQNWGFPTYNWHIMAKDGFSWWKARMQQLSQYFDAMRVDHILGFFRIWQVPLNQVQGTLGLFNPRLPFTAEELANFGISGDLSLFTKPFINDELLNLLFGNQKNEVIQVFLNKEQNGRWAFKSSFDCQQKVRTFISHNPSYAPLEKGLYQLHSEVLLLKEDKNHTVVYNPRITLYKTFIFRQLDPGLQERFTNLHNHYFYARHDAFWKEQALWKLPSLLDASDMLICGEDLGMIPASVPDVMNQMNIMSLEIQRMPKGNNRFGLVNQYPYFSVCSPSCHDMSTIRGWWESDYATANAFWHDYMGRAGEAPASCSGEIVRQVVTDHLHSPSMLAIFPIQDIIGMNESLRKEDALSEQINDPSNPKQYWKFRFHLTIESLLENKDFNKAISKMVKESGRQS